jgi:hypothetical protein
MIRTGKPPGLADRIASRYYGVPFGEVSRHVSQVAGTVAGRRMASRKAEGQFMGQGKATA